MENAIHHHAQPRVFNAVFLMRLAEANRALRQLRRMGCRIFRQVIGDRENTTVIVVDHNPHRVLSDCSGVHVVIGKEQA